MGSLSTCIKKAGELLAAGDRDAVFQQAAKYRAEGMTPRDAAVKAIQDQAGAAQTRATEVETALKEGRSLPGGGPEGPPRMFSEDVRVPETLPDGTERTVSANDYVARAQAEAETVKATSRNFMEAAATCLLGGI